MYDGEIIDSHMHLWDLENGYSWLSSPDSDLEKMIGDYKSLRKNFLAEDYMAIAKSNNITGSVHVEAFGFPEDPSLESRWLQDLSDKHTFPSAFVGYVKLDDDGAEEILKRHVAYKNVSGIRMALNWHEIPHLRMTDRPDYMQDESWLAGFSLLSKYNLSFDMQLFDHQLQDAKNIADRFLDTQIILEHLAWPTELSEAGFNRWKKNITTIAACPNVSIKISCLGCAFQKKITESAIIQYIKTAIDIFGTDRCLFGSNFPPDSLFYTLDEIVSIVKKATLHLSPAEQRKIFYSNCKSIYKII